MITRNDVLEESQHASSLMPPKQRNQQPEEEGWADIMAGEEAERDVERWRLPPSSEEHVLGELVRRIQVDVNECEAMEQLLIMISPWVEGEVRAHLRGWQREWIGVEDARQEVVLRVMHGIATIAFRGVGAFRAWLSQVARTTVRDLLKGMQTQRHGGGQHMTYGDLEEVARHVWRVRRESDADLAEQVRIFLGTLPAAQAAVVASAIMCDEPDSEVAQELGISERKVRRLRQKALRRLRARWEESRKRPP